MTTLNSIGQAIHQHGNNNNNSDSTTNNNNYLKISSQIDLTSTITVELYDVIDNGKRKVIQPHLISNKNVLPPGVDLIDGKYLQKPVDSTTVDIYKDVSVIILCINPNSLESYHYAVNLLQQIPQDILSSVFVVLAILHKDEPEVNHSVTSHMIDIITQGTTIQTLYISNQNGYGVDKLRTFLILPYLQAKHQEHLKLAALYQREMYNIQNKYLSPYLSIQNDIRDYQLYLANGMNSNNNSGNNGFYGNNNSNQNSNNNTGGLYDGDHMTDYKVKNTF
eukprot:UN02938